MTDDEDWIIEQFVGTSPRRGLVGIGDDAAVLPGGRIVTTDTMVEGTHWDDRLSAADVGWKLVAVNVSDCAAMGARPEWATLALTAPAPLDRAWITGFEHGVREACARWGLPLIGGDTTRGPCRTVTLTVGGLAANPVLRSGGRPGDDLWVAGELGLAAEALLAPAPRSRAMAHLRRPVPLLELGVALGERGLVTAMMDLSDGLARDLPRLCARSGCGARVTSAALPGDAPIDWRVGFGEDYGLLYTAHPSAQSAIASLGMELRLPMAVVGRLEQGPRVTLDDDDRWPAALFAHFPRPTPFVGAP